MCLDTFCSNDNSHRLLFACGTGSKRLCMWPCLPRSTCQMYGCLNSQETWTCQLLQNRKQNRNASSPSTQSAESFIRYICVSIRRQTWAPSRKCMLSTWKGLNNCLHLQNLWPHTWSPCRPSRHSLYHGTGGHFNWIYPK